MDKKELLKNKSLISIVIPVYKSTKSLEIISQQVRELSIDNYCFEIIFVNDSPFSNETCNILKKIEQEFHFVHVYTMWKNRGQHIALLVGLKQSKGDYIITMDDDLQNPVQEIPKLVSAITKDLNIDAVFAVPDYKEKKHSLWRNIGSFIMNRIDKLFLNKPIKLIKSPFRIITKDVSEVVVKNYNAMPALSSLIINNTDRIINIKVEHKIREFDKSNYTFDKLVKHAFNNILYYSSLPLKLAGIIGFIGYFISFIFIIYIVFRKLIWGINFPGYTSIVFLISFFGGLNLFCAGLIGEYLIRIVKEQQKIDLLDLIKK